MSSCHRVIVSSFRWEELAQIAARASILEERLALHAASAGADEEARARARLDRWRQVAAHGDQEAFARRLAWDGLDLDAARRMVSAARWPSGESLPPWTDILAAVASIAAQGDGDVAAHRAFEPAEPLPFEELFVPFLLVARRQLATRVGRTAARRCSDAAYADLERALLRRLSTLCAPALQLEFSVQRAQRRPSLDLLRAGNELSPPDIRYHAFVDELLAGGLRGFFREYCVLARLAATAVEDWVAAVAELLERLDADWQAIQRVFAQAGDLGPVVAVRASLSDPHRHGRVVMALQFASGRRLIYKPRNIGVEAAYSGLLEWLNQRAAPLRLKALVTLDRATHGWVECVAHAACQDDGQARRFYQRAGMLLCLLYVLGSTDYHYENLIACGEQPVLVDLETLMGFWLRDAQLPNADAGPESLTIQQLWDSVLRSGLLPRWEAGPDEQQVTDVSGLGSGSAAAPVRRLVWRKINTDAMAQERVHVLEAPRPSVPTLDGQPLAPEQYNDQLVAGFREMYGFLREHADLLLAPDGPLELLGGQEMRFVLRPTAGYAAIQIKALSPKYLRDGADYGIEIDFLSRGLLASEQRSPLWPLLARERRALQRQDIPLFTAHPQRDDLVLDAELTIAGCFTEPSYQQMIERLRGLNPEHMAQQIGLIRAAWYARVASGAAPALVEAYAPSDDLTAGLRERAELLRRAEAIAAHLLRHTIRASDRSVAWVGLEYMADVDRFQLKPIGPDLYSGTGGVALFLAALARLSGAAEWRELALSALQPFRAQLRDYAPALWHGIARQLGIGGATGLGSIVYALARTGQLLDDDTLLADAGRAARLLTPSSIEHARHADVVGGTAGAILGLLAWHQASGDATALELAQECGRCLLGRRVAAPSGHRVWTTHDNRPLTGFGHGAAGIAYALLRLHAVAPDAELFAAAQEAIAYERGTFDPRAGNWPDLRSEGDGAAPAFMCGWCSGAPGIAMARLGGLALLGTPEARAEVAAAIETTARPILLGVDHLCCGNAARVEALMVAAGRLARPELEARAWQLMGCVAARAERAGGYALLDGRVPAFCVPGLFQGIAGIGYTLLRLAEPQTLPSVLLWE